MNNEKKNINPLYIKDANVVMFGLTIDILILIAILESTGKFSEAIRIITYSCITFGLIFGLIICGGWIVAICTKNVVYYEPKPKMKGKDNNGNDNHKLQ
jgi:hypothetical protein